MNKLIKNSFYGVGAFALATMVAAPAFADRQYSPGHNEFGYLMVEDNWPNAGDEDFNDAVLRYNAMYDVVAGDINLAVYTISCSAIGSQGIQLGVGVTIPGVTAGDVDWVKKRVGTETSDGSWDATYGTAGVLTAWDGGGDNDFYAQNANSLRVYFNGTETIRDDCFPAAPNDDSFINTVQGEAILESRQIEVRVKFSTPIDGSSITGDTPDLFFHRATNKAHEIHQTQFPGSDNMNDSLFTASDAGTCGTDTAGVASGARNCFVYASGLPAVLAIADGGAVDLTGFDAGGAASQGEPLVLIVDETQSIFDAFGNGSSGDGGIDDFASGDASGDDWYLDTAQHNATFQYDGTPEKPSIFSRSSTWGRLVWGSGFWGFIPDLN